MTARRFFGVTAFGFSLGVLATQPVQAVNWMMLQGTEPPHVTHRRVVFMQPSLTHDFSDEISAGPNSGKRAVPATIAPWFNNAERAHFRRFRAGVRGRLATDRPESFWSKTNYFVLTELAPNLLTYDAFGDRARAIAPDHFSITFNHIPGARLRTGLFKIPGPEESYQGVINIDYIEFTGFTATQVLERFATGNIRQSVSGGTNGATGIPVDKGYGFNGVRDWAVQLFDAFHSGPWEYSYAVTLGRGDDIHTVSVDHHQVERYLYLSAEYDIPGGKGPRKNGIKTYVWHQSGERRFESDPLGQTFDRIRYGVGVRALGPLFGLSKRQRLSAEWARAEGMIFVGPVGGVKGGALQFAEGEDNTATGMYVDYGYFLDAHWELAYRWSKNDVLDDTDDRIWTRGDRRVWYERTYGVTYHVNPGSRITFNYIHRDIDAPNEPHAVVQNVVGSVEDRVALQWTKFF